jgi:prepilin peptidase CpaA
MEKDSSKESRLAIRTKWSIATLGLALIIGMWIIIAGLKTGILASAVLLCVVAGWIDFRTRRIPNWLTLPGLVVGVVLNTLVGGSRGLKLSLFGAGVGLLLLLPSKLQRSLGGGAWKLAGGLGAFVGPRLIVLLIFASSVVVGVMSVVLLIRQGRLWETLKRVLLRIPPRKDDPPPLKVPYGVALAFTVTLYGIASSLGWTA